VSFVADPGASVLVLGTYPKVPSPCVDPTQPVLRARFPGTIEVSRDSDGSLFVIGVLPFEEYLRGIAEMPRSWPMAALKAQAVAARSYALANLAYPDPTGDRLGYDLCATTACQVYAGMRVSAGPYGDRWRAAVRSTEGQVLLYKGRPADTLYFSTSNGGTVGNDKVFGTDPLPYLRPITEPDDGASPLSHWRSVLPHQDVARFLRAAGDWGPENVSSVSVSGSNVVVKGGGRSTTIPVTDFRSALNYWAPCLDPARFPPYDDGSQLPQTIPSKWFSTTNADGAAVLTGRGWGHGVGMVQWGAYGKALNGVSYRDILAEYYGGLRPKSYDEPATIRIGIATGLKTVTIQPTGSVAVAGMAAGRSPWLVTGGKRLELGHGKRIAPTIAPGRIVAAPERTRVGRTIRVSAFVPDLSVARLVFRVPGAADATMGTGVTVGPGTVELSGEVPDLPPGSYGLQVEVTNGTDIVRTRAHDVVVTGGTVPTPSPSPSLTIGSSTGPTASGVALAPAGTSRTGTIAAIAVGAAAVAALAALLLLRRRLRRSGPPAV
jgi:SpoIID/LytB domain protein